MEKLTYTVKEAADLIGLSLPTLYELCHKQGFPAIFIGRKILIPKVELKEWLSREARGDNEDRLF